MAFSAARAFRRPTLLGLTLIFALCTLRGAPAQAPDQAAVNPGEPKPDTLHVLYTGVEANIDAMHYAADKYQKMSGIKVVVDSFPQTAMREKLFAEMAAHSNYYDVTVGDMPWGSALTPHLVNVLAYALNTKVTDPKLLGLSDIIPQLVVESTYSPTQPFNPPMEYQMPNYTRQAPISLGEMQKAGWSWIGVPFQPNVLVMAYRKDWFSNAANQTKFRKMFNRPLAPPTDWGQYLQTCKFFTRSYNPQSPTQYGCTAMAKKHESLYTDWRTWCRTFGVVEIDQKMDPAFATPEGVKCTQFYGDLINKYKVVSPDATNWTWDEVTTEYGSGRAAIAMNYHRMLLDPQIAAKGGVSGFALVPGDRVGGKLLLAPHYGTYFLGIPKYSDHPRWAWDFILHAQSASWQKEYARFQYHGTRYSYYRDPAVVKVFPDYWPVFSESLPLGYARPRIEAYVNYSEIMQEEIHKFLLGQESAEDALKNARANEIKLFDDEGYYEKLGVPAPAP